MRFDAHTLVEGEASGEVVVLDEPLSFWGGLDPRDGSVIDARHPQAGASLRGKVVVMPSGRGSSSSSSTLAEAARAGTAPAAIVLREPDLIVAVGMMVATELYGTSSPVVTVVPEVYERLAGGVTAAISARTQGADISITGPKPT